MRAIDTLERHDGGTMVRDVPPAAIQGNSTRPAERRVVTVLFCDVVGSTGMAEFLDPEEWADVMNIAYENIMQPIERYGGTITRLIGDAVMAVFGAPQAHADDPKRAILAGLEIIQEIDALSEQIRTRHGFDFNVRVGINTGLAVVGEFGSGHRAEYTAMGDVTNVAARIQALAEPGTIQVGELTYRLAQDSFTFEALGTQTVRGKSQPEKTYQVVKSVRAQAGNAEKRPGTMPFVGRQQAMKQLKAAIDDLHEHGRGRVIAIHGESGIGKSRLVREVVEYATSLDSRDGEAPIALLENRISPYDASRPYSAVQSRFRKVFGIDPDDPPEVIRSKFRERSAQLPPEFRDRAARVIQRVMALNLDDEGSAEVFEHGDFRSELSIVVRRIVECWNPDGAFMLVGEDYHWIDTASLKVVSELYSLVENRPVLFLSTFRPEPNTAVMDNLQAARERLGDHLLEIALEPLSSNDTKDLLCSLIPGETVAAESLRLLIQSRAEGNPLFIEEILKSLVEQGAIEPVEEGEFQWQPVRKADLTDLSLPTSLRALLLERIDRLEPEAKHILQRASALGRSFSQRVLQEITDTDGDDSFERNLSVLRDASLIHRQDENSDEMLEFRHSLVQDAVYETILHRHRREIHRRAAEAMETLFVGREQEIASAIASHYYNGQDDRAVGWLIQAAKQSSAVYEPAATADYASKAIAFARSTGIEPPAEAYKLRGQAYDAAGNFEAARADFSAVLDYARQTSDREMEWQALLDLGSSWAESDYACAESFIRESLAVARALSDRTKIAHSLNRLGNWHINRGNPNAAIDAHQEARAIFEDLNDREGLAESLDLLGLARDFTGDLVTSADAFQQAISLFREDENDRGLSSSLAMLALTGGGIDDETVPSADGPAEEWIGYTQEALELARKIGWRAGEAFALATGGAIRVHHGQLRKGLETLRQAIALADEIGHHQWSVAARSNLGILAVDLMQWNEGNQLLKAAHRMALELGSDYWTRSTTSHLIALYLATGRIDAAEAQLGSFYDPSEPLNSLGARKLAYRAGHLALYREQWANALEISERLLDTVPKQSGNGVAPRLNLLRGSALRHLGNLSESVTTLEFGLQRAVEIGNRSITWRVGMELSYALRTSGDDVRADAALDNARAISRGIADQLDRDCWHDAYVERSAAFKSLNPTDVVTAAL